MEPLFTLAATELRRLLEQLLRTEADFDAFVLDYFPDVKRRYSATMDRVAKTNLLLELVERGVLSGQLRTIYPDAFSFILMIEKGSDVGRQYPLPRVGCIVIGRALEADIRLPEQDMQVSRRHALLSITQNEIALERQGRLPIYVEGIEVKTAQRLKPGDGIEIHRTLFRLHAGSSRASERTDTPESAPDRESMPAARSSAFRLFWGLADRMLEMKRFDEVERMVGRRLDEIYDRAVHGERFPVELLAHIVPRILKIAQATQKTEWWNWIFTLASACTYRLEPAFLDEISAAVLAQRPPIGAAIRYYAATMQADSELWGRLQALSQTL